MVEKLKKRAKYYIIIFLAAANIFLWYAVFQEDRRGTLTFAVLDIGQGDALFIDAPNGNQIMIDGGPDSTVLRKLGQVMAFYDRSIDMLIVSNPDSDHIGGFIPILNLMHVGVFMEPGTISPSGTYKSMEQLIGKKNIPKIIARRGMKFVIAPEVFLYILFPDRDVSTLTTNDGSIIAKLVYKNTSIMLTGDAPQKAEKYLVELDGANLQSDILKVGHHGSRTATSPEFVKSVKPLYAAISAGFQNTYGFPHPETVKTLNEAGIQSFITLGKGTLLFTSNGEKWTEKRLGI